MGCDSDMVLHETDANHVSQVAAFTRMLLYQFQRQFLGDSAGSSPSSC